MAEAKKRTLTVPEQESRGDQIALLAKKYKSLAGLPDSHVHTRSKDGKTVLLLDGTRVTDEILKTAAKPEKEEK
ncbi:MAG TPA: hypothetical protein VF747_06640 [Blastocatellia bacterium]|jgi:hypothetical protein